MKTLIRLLTFFAATLLLPSVRPYEFDLKKFQNGYTRQEYLDYFNRKFIDEGYSWYLEVAYSRELGFHTRAREVPIPPNTILASIPLKYHVNGCKLEVAKVLSCRGWFWLQEGNPRGHRHDQALSWGEYSPSPIFSNRYSPHDRARNYIGSGR